MDCMVKRNYGFTFMALVIILLATSFLGGCEEENARSRYTREILRCLEEGDGSALKAMFVETIRNDNYVKLDEQIERALKFFHGKVISYHHTGNGGTKSVSYGIVEKWFVVPQERDIKTDSGDVYSLSYSFYLENREKPNLVGGLIHITIINNSGTKCEIG